MAHLAGQSAAIFSPSVARAAASAARDWNFIDGWLAARFQGRPPPPFERNADTLRALLALAALNEAADEDRGLLAAVETQALREAEADEKARQARMQDGAPDAILDAVVPLLSRDGLSTLDALADTAGQLDIAFPTPEAMGEALVLLQRDIFSVEQSLSRVALLQRHIDAECDAVSALEADLRAGEAYQPATDLARQNLEAQRRVKAAVTRLPEMRDRAAALEKEVQGRIGVSVEMVKADEAEYMDLLAQRKDLDGQVKAYRGLPTDVDAARRELEDLRDELRELTRRRDDVFEGLVERETPKRVRRHPDR
jgi:HAUS augmin-like complex subunit 1